MYSDTGNTTSLVLGFPIRTSSDQRSVDSSPRLIAASYVLHRPLMPRHPPCALKHLQHKNQLFEKSKLHHNNPQTPHTRSLRRNPGDHCCELMLATTIHESNTTPHHQNLGQQHASHHTQWPGKHGPVVSKPNSVSGDPHPRTGTHPKASTTAEARFLSLVVCTRTGSTTDRGPSTDSPADTVTPQSWAGRGFVVLLRKEVIQPHLPVRLPCYDFVPIADPTFDGSLPRGVRPPASGVTDFHDVTGGVYKARERIHRSVADLRLLATPTSRGRVADPDPN